MGVPASRLRWRVWRVTVGKKGQAGVATPGVYEVWARKTHAQLWVVGRVGRDRIGDETSVLMGDGDKRTDRGVFISEPRALKKVWLWKFYLGPDWYYGQVYGKVIHVVTPLVMADEVPAAVA